MPPCLLGVVFSLLVTATTIGSNVSNNKRMRIGNFDDLPTYVSAAMRQYLDREERRAQATESFCSLINSTDSVNIDLQKSPQGYLSSHEDYHSSWADDNKTREGLPIVCKWRLVPPSARDSDDPEKPQGPEMTDLLSFTFEKLDIPLDSDRSSIPGFQCEKSFLRFYLTDRDNYRVVLAEFCGQGWLAGFDIPLLRGSTVLLHARLLNPFRGFRIFYESTPREEMAKSNEEDLPDTSLEVSNSKDEDKTMENVILQDETYSETELIATNNKTHRYEQACLSDDGITVTGLSGKIRFIQPANSSVWCKWQIKPNVTEGAHIKYVKFRVPHFKIDKSTPPCRDNLLEISFSNEDNVTRIVNSYCELKLPQPKRWQKADVLRQMELIFRSKTAKLAAGFELEYYVVLASQNFLTDVQQCGRSRMKFQPETSVVLQMSALDYRHQMLLPRSRLQQQRPSPSVTPPSLPPTKETHLKRNKRVVGGHISRPGSWPWIAMLSFFGYPLCAATILNERWLLTAAHCFKNERKNVAGWEIVIGKQTSDAEGGIAWDYQSKVLRPTIELILTHYRYGRSRNPKEFDIALVKVEQPIPLGKIAAPICPPSESLSGSEICYVIGYGETNDTQTAGFLNEVQLPLIPNDKCRTMNPFYSQYVTESMLCAGYIEGGRDNCRGDNGGPFVCYVNERWELHGIVSWGKGCAKANAPGVYTRVSTYLHWIQKVVNNYQ